MPKRKVDKHGRKLVYGSEFYRVSSLDCCVCGEVGWWAHHLKRTGNGGVDKGNIVPLCLRHHSEVTNGGDESFEKKYDVDFKQVAKDVEP